MRVRAHPCVALRRQRGEIGHEPSFVVEQLLRPVTAQPFLQLRTVVAVVAHGGDRYLMRAPCPFDRLPVDLARPGPALRRPEDQHRPALRRRGSVLARSTLYRIDAVERLVQRGRETLVH